MKFTSFIAACCAASTLVASAQNFAVNRFTIDGGGGTSTGSIYTVNGTIGQPDAGSPLTGGINAVSGGFWNAASLVQTLGAPLLSIERLANGEVRIYWSQPASGFLLEQTSALTTPASNILWNPVAFSYETNATQISVSFPPTLGNSLFRLRRP